MFRTKRLNDPPPVPYCVQYGPRSGLRTANGYTAVVDHSFLRPRPPCQDLEDIKPLDQDWLDEQLEIIKNFEG